MKQFRKLAVLVLSLFFGAIGGLNAQKTFTADLSKPGSMIQPTMWGIFFEDINFAADGGIYAEMVKNRSFGFYKPLMGWETVKQQNAVGDVQLMNFGTGENNNRYIRITNQTPGTRFGLRNEGFRGMGIKKGEQYNIRMKAKALSKEPVHVTCELLDSSKNVIGSVSLNITSSDWAFYEASVVSNLTTPKGSLNVLIDGAGDANFSFISMFPENTWKNRKYGFRADLVQMLADLKPGFIRFPGGCIVEGHELSTRYQWKKTVGEPEDRKVQINRWNQEFSWRSAPDYFQSFGMGFFEYFLLAEDIGAEPVPILNCGMACQYNTGELVPLDKLDPYTQDALDLIEFANGDVSTQWGKLRKEMGHPEPFHLKFLGVGNEQWGSQYVERFLVMSKIIQEKYPEIKLISGSGPSPSGDKFDYLWGKMGEMNADLVDEHYYMSPGWFLANARRYDTYDRKGPAVFAGEYAAHDKEGNYPSSRNNWRAALSEAAFMTGLERNADIVHLSSYAPLFANINAWQWNPDLIWFNNLEVMATPNYYVQKMFSTHKGTRVVPVTLNKEAVAGQDSLYASASFDEPT
ncbi:MAG TPA: alpha-L-arabinofuranosidase C-terminal domain-containing protein, partial [Prolixibacteraceae bacterium]|nr:alpha-L-arabinofuranosidase C-terminal domain-containing protein [Prolixibacteraceae bacterium]